MRRCVANYAYYYTVERQIVYSMIIRLNIVSYNIIIVLLSAFIITEQGKIRLRLEIDRIKRR